MSRALEKVRGTLGGAALFIRFSALSFSVVLPLLGAGTVMPHLHIGQALGLVAVALLFHTFAYVLNDVVDLPIDRTQPLRQQYPLVAGRIRPRTALIIALAQVPLAYALTFAMAPRAGAYIALTAAFALLAAYDLWGKRIAFPLLMDLVQALGWSALALYGASAANGVPNRLTGVACAFVAVYVVMVNGVHGGLRDLANDLAHGVRTTPQLFGVSAAGAGFSIPLGFVGYAIGLQILLAGIVVTPLALGWLPYGPLQSFAALAAILAVLCLAIVSLVTAARNFAVPKRVIAAGTGHILLVLGSLLILFLPMLDRHLSVILLITYVCPMLWGIARRRRGGSGGIS